MQRPRSMSSKVSSNVKGGLILFFYLFDGTESYTSIFQHGLHSHQQRHKLSHTMHSFSGRPYPSGLYEPTLTSSPTTLALSASSTLLALKSSNTFILSALLIVSSCGLAIEKNTTVGKALSAPLVTMLISLCLANIGVVPFESSIYQLVNKFLVPLAVPLFLFDSDLKRVVRDAGSLLIAFLLGALSTVVGTLVTFTVIPLKALGENGWKVACALTARHIGGAINFVAVAETLNIDGGIVSSAIAADNVVVALYFAILFYLATANDANKSTWALDTKTTSKSSLGQKATLDEENITTSSIAYSVATASCLFTIGSAITDAICPTLSSLVITSVLTVVSATLFSSWFERLRTSGTAIGTLFLQMFFAASGAGGSIMLVLRQAPSLFLFSALQIAVHFLALWGLGRGLMQLNSNELYLASNANIGGPTTAAAMAKAKNWETLPALLVGVLGYGIATALSLALGPILIRLAR